MARLTAPNGAKVDVADDKVDRLRGQGFTEDGDTGKKATTRAKSTRTSKAKPAPAGDAK